MKFHIFCGFVLTLSIDIKDGGRLCLTILGPTCCHMVSTGLENLESLEKVRNWRIRSGSLQIVIRFTNIFKKFGNAKNELN